MSAICCLRAGHVLAAARSPVLSARTLPVRCAVNATRHAAWKRRMSSQPEGAQEKAGQSSQQQQQAPPPGVSAAQAAYARQRQEKYTAKNRALLMYTTAVIIGAVGVTYAAVPLYRMFCAATGFAGTPNVGQGGRFAPERLVPVDDAHRIRVHFNADHSEQLPWKFIPQQKFVNVLPGETSLAFYKAKNVSNEDIIGIATYNVTPDRIAPYFSKVECFCFEEQRLLAGEEVDMPILFFIDKDMLEDPSCRHVDDVVLSYTFFRARRNAHGQLEPDAADDAVQHSLGFDQYEHAPKHEERKEEASS
ncbi:cytochrome c oxidase assembly protein CtaG/Cox11-domain-containing protein [Schizophyllum commune]